MKTLTCIWIITSEILKYIYCLPDFTHISHISPLVLQSAQDSDTESVDSLDVLRLVIQIKRFSVPCTLC